MSSAVIDQPAVKMPAKPAEKPETDRLKDGHEHHIFWDIESYRNLFLCGMLDDSDHLEMFYRVPDDHPEYAAEIDKACKDRGFPYQTYDLAQDMSRFRWHFEKKIPTSDQPTLLASFLGEKDQPVLPKTNWYFGYNTLAYDVPMCDHIIQSSLANRLQTTTNSIREYSDTLINRTARYTNTKAYQRYGNQVDCAMLNEKMVDKGRPTIGLKTLVGIKGGSIIESESNHTGLSDNIYTDTLYNINDITELRDIVYPGVMEQAFKVRRSLLARFPKLTKLGVTVNSTSATFVSNIVAPDGPIIDTPVVSYAYPAKHMAERLHVKQIDVLEDTKRWYMESVFKKVAKNNPQAALNHLVKFMSIYQYYDDVRGKNWNESALHAMTYGNKAYNKADRRALQDKYGTFLSLIDKYGRPTGTYVNFSIGGIHGAEINSQQLAQDRAKIKELRETYGKISMIPTKVVSSRLLNLIKVQSRTRYRDYPLHLSHEISMFYHKTRQVDEILPPEEFTPFMYDDKKDGHKEALIGRYKYTSIGDAIHQDFAGYYPMLLVNLGVFYNEKTGKDDYNDVRLFRLTVKKKLKTLKFGTLEYEDTNIEQLGYKLVLNSASGILDGTFDTNVRANNKAMAMRIIGQLFTFRIAMALALEGAKIPSSNTDGIYAFNIELERNRRIVDHELESLYVPIEPEPLYLVSKDSNNRMEMVDGTVTSASGATLTSWAGAQVNKRLSHPALVDKIMTLYLQNDGILDGEANLDKIREALTAYHNHPEILDVFKKYPDAEKRTFVYMSSWVMRSTSGSIMIDDLNHIYPGTERVWLTKTGRHLSRYATRKQKPSATLEEFASKLFPESKLGNPDLIQYLTDVEAYGKYFDNAITVKDYLAQRQKTINDRGKAVYGGDSVYTIGQSKISHLGDTATVYLNNASIIRMSAQEIDQIYGQIDLEQYVHMIGEFAKVWQNRLEKS